MYPFGFTKRKNPTKGQASHGQPAITKGSSGVRSSLQLFTALRGRGNRYGSRPYGEDKISIATHDKRGEKKVGDVNIPIRAESSEAPVNVQGKFQATNNRCSIRGIIANN